MTIFYIYTIARMTIFQRQHRELQELFKSSFLRFCPHTNSNLCRQTHKGLQRTLLLVGQDKTCIFSVKTLLSNKRQTSTIINGNCLLMRFQSLVLECLGCVEEKMELLLIALYSTILHSWADSLRSHGILHEWTAFYSLFLNSHWSGVFTVLA